MIQLRYVFLCFAVAAMALNSGCTQSKTSSATSLTSGMKMQDAVSVMQRRGMDPQQLAFSKLHNAFDLSDGRMVILVGDKIVDEIQTVSNPGDPKGQWKVKTVMSLKL